mgnify:FL=1|tara:strand:- start:172 stop:570 length:399 start_codon:yes stop_codon:yes gene_type:complete
MKKSELKNIIKECVREVILEEGMLSGIVSEVVQGIGTASLMQEVKEQPPRQVTQRIAETKQQVLKAVAAKSYEDVKKKFSNPELFEGTQPIVESKGGKGGALSGVAPNDPGVDISNIPGFGSWSNVAAATRK